MLWTFANRSCNIMVWQGHDDITSFSIVIKFSISLCPFNSGPYARDPIVTSITQRNLDSLLYKGSLAQIPQKVLVGEKVAGHL